MTTERPRRGDYALLGLLVAFVVGSLTAMVTVVTAAPRPLHVLIVEPATWVAATSAVAWIGWRRTFWGRS